LTSFLDDLLWEEIQTSRAWIYVDYPVIENIESLTATERKDIKPFPVIWKAESVINWQTGLNKYGRYVLKRVITREFIEELEEGKFHPKNVVKIFVHELDELGYYQVRTFKVETTQDNVKTVNGTKLSPDSNYIVTEELTSPNKNILINGDRLDMIPAWPVNGQIEPVEPMLSTIMDKECALYNKMSRRNHLLYGAATYTPVLTGDVSDEKFREIVDAGLGSWLNIPSGCIAGILETPTAALADMDKAIASNIEEIAKLGVRMLTPEIEQSGIALELRNASQVARLGTLNNRISATMTQVIAFMIRWRYNVEILDKDVIFVLSEDFDHTPLGADWLRLATEWYQQGLIPRSVWIEILKRNDMIKADYDDEEGQKEISSDEIVVRPKDEFDLEKQSYEQKLRQVK
jgi:hypothetical protein